MWKKVRAGRRGSVVLELLLALPVLIFLAFFLPHYVMIDSRQTQMQTVLDRYLQEAQLQGGFSVDLWAAMEADLTARRFDVTRVRFDGSTPVGERRRRGETIELNIGYPRGNALNLVRLVLLPAPDPARLMWVQGTILSERP